MKWPLALVVLAGTLQGQELPSWWKAMLELPRLESVFRQESESAVFGNLRREGRLQLSRGGRIRVSYAGGLLVVSDGKTLIQYDPGARTAQRLDLRTAAAEMPLLNVLLDPRALDSVYRARVLASGVLVLEPRKPGLPKVELEGKGAFLGKISWMDATGAKQVLELVGPRIPSAIPDSTYKLRVPEGTRWLEVR
jgi:outer membrane lipoprotein-sorting protein